MGSRLGVALPDKLTKEQKIEAFRAKRLRMKLYCAERRRKQKKPMILGEEKSDSGEKQERRRIYQREYQKKYQKLHKASKMHMIYKPDSSNIAIEVDPSCVIHSHVCIHEKVKLGKNCKVQSFAFIPNGVEIEDDVFIGPHVCFTNDPKMDIVAQGEFTPTKTLIKRGAKIGANACILAGVTIGERAIIGMGSVVLHDVAPGETVVGNPARPIGRK